MFKTIRRVGRLALMMSPLVLGAVEVFAATVPTIAAPRRSLRVVRVRYQPVGACLGVDDSIAPAPVAIMAPVGGINNARATIAPASQVSRVQFNSANTAIATVSPVADASSQIQVSGVVRGETLIRAQTATSGVLRTLTASAKPRLDRTIAIHAITEQNDDVQLVTPGQTSSPNGPCVGQGGNGFRDSIPAGDDQAAGADINAGANGICQTTARATNLVPAAAPTAAALQTYLNSIWGQQANVFFTVTRNDAVVNYDLDRSGVLADPVLGSATDAEIGAMAAQARAGADFNIYFINSMEIPHAFTLGAAGIAANLQNSAWVQDAHANSTLNVSAHEVGHLLGIQYETNNAQDVMLSFGSATNPCEVRRRDWNTVNP